MLKTGSRTSIPFLKRLFNVLFSSGLYPKEWAKAIIIPIHKKGDIENTDNYRGVSLLSIISKCYSTILNGRLYAWLEDNNLISECQAGFRKKYSTIDHIFCLHSIVQKSLSQRGKKLYVAFVDLKKAFHSVRQDKLLQSIRNWG